MNRILIFTAFFLKRLNFPRPVKYLFYLFIKGKKIFADSVIDISKSRLKLNIGNFIEYWIYMDGAYEEEWIRNILPLVENRILVDVGANVGVYPLALFKKVSFIYAFEPEKSNYARLMDNIQRNNISNIEAINKAVSDQTKRASLFISNDSGSHSLLLHSNIKKETVDVISLDNFFKRKKIDIGLIKIDVEGAEFNVLRGAGKLLERCRPALLIEFNSAIAKICDIDLLEMYKYLARRHYVAYKLYGTRLRKINWFEIDNIYNENLLFLWGGK